MNGHLDFSGIKGQPELTNNFATPTSPKPSSTTLTTGTVQRRPVICATEDDMDGALTMQIMHKHHGHPGAFRRRPPLLPRAGHLGPGELGPARHLVRRPLPKTRPRTWPKVHLYPEEFYFPAGGAAVHHLAAAGEITLARLSRLDGSYRMQVTLGRFETLRRGDQ